jgi:hypothetical protein
MHSKNTVKQISQTVTKLVTNLSIYLFYIISPKME